MTLEYPDFSERAEELPVVSGPQILPQMEFQPGEMVIFIKWLTGKRTALSVAPSDTIEDVKNKFQDKEGLVPDMVHRLLFNGFDVNAEDGHSLDFYGVGPSATLDLVMRVRGD